MPRRVPDVPPALRLLLGRADLPGGGGARLMQLLIAAVLCNTQNLNIFQNSTTQTERFTAGIQIRIRIR